MKYKQALVVTTINAPNPVLKSLAAGAAQNQFGFFVMGDTKTPKDFRLENSHYWSVEDQIASDFSFAKICPTRHYARKNIGYLAAARDGAEIIIETDDDNYPRDGFFKSRERRQHVKTSEGDDWVNAYAYFSEARIWPRGFPLENLQKTPPPFEQLTAKMADCPIQQGLADANPDVDAVYRLILPLPQNFRTDRRMAIGRGSWCPFNSQNTAFWADAFPLLYLPANCSFRMTDIWRSFVAQRIAWENDWSILFHEPTVWQDRNEHDLMKDFADEIPGYLNNLRICRNLQELNLKSGTSHLGENLLLCYEALVKMGLVDAAELKLVEAWNSDLAKLGARS